jgi:hypothetical protein
MLLPLKNAWLGCFRCRNFCTAARCRRRSWNGPGQRKKALPERQAKESFKRVLGILLIEKRNAPSLTQLKAKNYTHMNVRKNLEKSQNRRLPEVDAAFYLAL